MSKTWSLSTLNVNGIRACVRHGFWDWFADLSPDVLCLQEVRMQREQVKGNSRTHLAPEGWTSARADAEKRGYSGTAVWTHLPVSAQGIGCGHAGLRFFSQPWRRTVEVSARSIPPLSLPMTSSVAPEVMP